MDSTFTIFDAQICSYRQSLMHYAVRFTHNPDDADDLVQETLAKALRFKKNYKPDTNLRAWLFTILKNTFLNNYKSMSRRKVVLVADIDPRFYPVTEWTSRNSGEGRFIIKDVNSAIRRLKPEYAVPFLRFFEGYKYEEIACELGIPIGTVKTRIHFARKFLKAELKMYDKCG